jgi:hypothetical protein
MSRNHASLFSRDPRDLWEHYFKKELNSAADWENRVLLLELADKYGPDWVWEHRKRLVDLMRYFGIDFTGRSPNVASC